MRRTRDGVRPTFSHALLEVDMASGEGVRQEVPPVDAEVESQRDRDEFSYVDVYLPGEAAFMGSFRVSDRVMGFDLLGSTLVVVVERQLSPDDADGIPDRAVDWYDIGEWR